MPEHPERPLMAVDAPPVVLASASAARAALLAGAGIACVRRPAAIDEAAIKRRLREAGADIGVVATALAMAKAQRVAAAEPDALVIGADQMLACGDAWLDKPADRGEARRQIGALRGRSHQLVTGAVVARGDAVLWRRTERATLAMRAFSDAFLDVYLDAVGDQVCASVGGYQLEGPGAQLFEAIEGDYFTVLGLPLLPLLAFLREQGVLAT